jgi:hypothetical protein
VENNKKDLQKDFDSICLKDHLNASFDNDNISVSEDLIARTLKAIKAQEEIVSHDQNADLEENAQPNILEKINSDTKFEKASNVYEFEQGSKKKPFPIRRFVSAAAILAVLLIGVNVIQDAGLPNVSYKENSTGNSEENLQFDTANDSASINSTTMMESESAPMEGNEELDSFTESTLIEENAASMESATEDTVQKDTTQNDTMMKADNGLVEDNLNVNSFSALYLGREDSILSTTLFYNKQEASTTDINKINELVGILDKYTLEVRDISSSKTWNYMIYLETENQIITVYVGEDLKVVVDTNGNLTENYYQVNTIDTLVEEVDEFYKNMSK